MVGLTMVGVGVPLTTGGVGAPGGSDATQAPGTGVAGATAQGHLCIETAGSLTTPDPGLLHTGWRTRTSEQNVLEIVLNNVLLCK